MKPTRRLARRRVRLVVAALVAALAAAVPACLPSLQFESPSAGDGGEGGTPGVDGGDTSSPGDGPSDGDAGAPVDSRAPDGDAAPGVLGPFANDQFGNYAMSGRCAVRLGTLYCWGGLGSNLIGQLGFPPDTEDAGAYPQPTPVPATAQAQPASEITQIAMGGYHTCTLYGRTAYCRGANDDNELGNPAGATGPDEIAVLGLPASGLDSIAAANKSTCGITLVPDAGSVSNVYCWGTNGEAELGRPFNVAPAAAAPVTGALDGGPTGAIPDAIAIAGGGDHHCALTSTSAILCWGGTQFYQSGPLQGSTDCPGGNETMCSDQPQLVTLPSGETATALALGYVHSCALAKSGSVYCWGWSNANQLGNTGVTQICTDANQTTGPCTGTPVKVTGLTGIQRLSAGGYETCGLDQAHHAHCWGYNGDGELGEGDTAAQTAPVVVADPLTGIPFMFDDLAVGAEGVCARNGDTLYCWGGGALGTEAPDGAMPASVSPATVQL